MDIETITKLLDAGYTKAEIEAMAGEPTGAGESAGAEPESAGENKGAENESKIEAAGVPVDFGAAITALTDTVNGLKDTVKAMQEKNAGAASTEKPDKNTVDDVMKTFIDSL